MKNRIVLSVWLLLGLATFARSAPLDNSGLSDALDSLIEGHSTFRRTIVCLKVVDIESGDVLYDRHGSRLLTPASNLKMYTSACALDAFGPEHRFTTRVKIAGTMESDSLKGDLVLVGGGDAMLTHQDLAKLAERVTEQWGIRRVEGDVRVDNSRYGSPLKGPGWMWDDDPDYYNMPITPLMLDFNVMMLKLTQDATGLLSAKFVPETAYPAIKTVEPNRLPGTRLFWRAPFTDTVLLAKRGNLKEYLKKLKEKDQKPRLTMNDPGQWVAAVFKAMLENEGVEFVEKTKNPQSGSAEASIDFESRPLAETLKHFNHKSENAVGEVLLHEIAIARGTSQPKWSDGAKAISNWLVDKAGLEAGSFRLVDGSGLSRYNLISADSAVQLLQWMRDHRHYESFRGAMPGYELELQEIDWPNAPAEGFDSVRVWAKSGGMSGVSTISGYARTLDGRMLAFSLLANGFVGSYEPVKDLRQQVWQTLIKYRHH